MCMHNALGNRAIEGTEITLKMKVVKKNLFVVLANHLLVTVEQNQSWQVGV